MTHAGTDRSRLKGVLICALNSGYLEFDYLLGDSVKDLKEKIREVWGMPDLTNSDYFHKNRWAIFCRCEDGTYSMLVDSDPIPACPPRINQTLDSVHADWAMQPLREILAAETRWDSTRCDQFIDEMIREQQFGQRRRDKSSNAKEIEGSISYEEILQGDYRSLKVHRGVYMPHPDGYDVELLALVAVVGG